MPLFLRDWEVVRRALWFAATAFIAAAVILSYWPASARAVFMVLALVTAIAALFAARRADSPDLMKINASGDAVASLIQPLAREIFERQPDPVMLMDSAGRVLFANKSMRGAVGTDALNKHVSAVLRTPNVLQAVSRTIETGLSADFEFAVQVPVERHYQAYVLRTDQTPHITALIFHDMTALVRAERARADFVANASHELRTPLAAVSGFIDTLRGHAKDDPGAREKFLDIMSIEAGRMRRLIDDLLSLTRIEINEHVPPSGRVNIAEVVHDASTVLGPLAQADNITIAVKDPGNIPPVVGERDELTQLFQNLMHNAIKYGRDGGHVWVTLSVGPNPSPAPRRGGPSQMVCVTVKDDGEGIPREAIPRLTERFYRVDVKRSRERGGTGLGLAIVKHIVNRHQGRMQIESEAGQGSTFIIHLPATA